MTVITVLSQLSWYVTYSGAQMSTSPISRSRIKKRLQNFTPSAAVCLLLSTPKIIMANTPPIFPLPSCVGNIQFDDPLLAYFCAESMITGMEKEGIDHEKILTTYIKAYQDCLKGKPEDMNAGLHLCRGNFRVRIYLAFYQGFPSF